MFSSSLSNLAISQKPQHLRAAIFCRVSTADQAAEGRAGLERQIRANAAVAASAGYEIVREFVLSDVSGSSSYICTEMLEMIALIEAGEIEVVIVTEMSRLFRPDDLASFAPLEILRRNGVLLNCGGSVHDLNTPEGFLSSGIMGLMGGFDRQNFLRRVSQARETIRLNGGCPGGNNTLPLGLSYNRTKRKFAYTEDIWRVQMAFKLVEEGIRSFSEIGRRVGVPRKVVKTLLSNTFVIGIRSYLTIRDQSRKVVKAGGRQGYRPMVNRSPDQVIRVRIFAPEEQAVTDEQFARVQLILADIKDRHARHIAPLAHANLLVSAGRCGFCGNRIYASNACSPKQKSNKFRGHYICKCKHEAYRKSLPACSQGWMRREPMDELLSAFVVKFLEDPEFITGVLEYARAKQRDRVIQINSVPSSIRNQIAEIDKRDRRLIDAIEADAISLEEAKLRRENLRSQKAALLLTLTSTEQQPAENSMPTGLIGRIAAMGVNAWNEISCPRERKEFVTKIFAEVYVKGESISAFRIASTLLGNGSGAWQWIADVPVTLPVPFRIKPIPEVIPVPDGCRFCVRCKEILPLAVFYGPRRSCRPCENAARAIAEKARKQGKS